MTENSNRKNLAATSCTSENLEKELITIINNYNIIKITKINVLIYLLN